MIRKNGYDIQEETYLKAYILTNGVIFSKEVLEYAYRKNVKRQNLVYNQPIDSDENRPQELIVENEIDGYQTVISCINTNKKRNPAKIVIDRFNNLKAIVEGDIINNIKINFVEEPEYYREKLKNGESVKTYVSACGLDELNIIPWKGCSISKKCKFCGINNFCSKNEITSYKISRNNNVWKEYSEYYLKNLKESLKIAITSKCYTDHFHLILISGNLSNSLLDYEADIFSEISNNIKEIVSSKSKEGIIAVITPPNDLRKIDKLKKSGIDIIVFNLEAITKTGFKEYCPGKNDLGYDYFVDRLEYAVKIFGLGNVWTNLVYGLEDKEMTLNECEKIINKGIVVGANILHLDKGNTLPKDFETPNFEDVIDFFYNLNILNLKKNFKPFYCSKALRTSLTNEVYEKRILKK